MATTKGYKDYVLELLGTLDNITYKPMMGEYLLYYQGVLFGGVYDDRFLVKKVKTNEHWHMEEAIPYEGAKAMYLVDIEDLDIIKEIVLCTCKGLKEK